MVPHLRMAMACLVVSITFNSKAMVLLRTHYQVALSITSLLTLLLMVWRLWQMLRPWPPCYLLDFCCTEAEGNINANEENFKFFLGTWRDVKQSNLEFQFKVLSRSGVGGESYAPPRLIQMGEDSSLSDARIETENLIEKATRRLLAKLSIDPKEIDILILNSSLFNPIPSLTSYVVNSLHMRSNVKSFNLAGMGCSAGVIAIDLAARLLRSASSSGSSSSGSSHPSLALVVSMENITLNWYLGNDPSKLVSNCIFRMGGAAILLSSRPSDRTSAKYELVHTVRTHKGADDKAYRCVYQEEDDDVVDQEGHRHSHGHGKVGVSLSKELMAIAGNALKANITTLGPLVLPLSEQILFFASLILRKLAASGYGYGYGDGGAKMKPYIPDFKRAFEHFCIHAGGRAVLDELEKNLGLSEWHMEPSRMTLYRFGNTSSSSLWYELAYTEAKGRVKKGDRLWQIAFGSGFKCNSAVWRALSAIAPTTEASINNPWSDIIHKFPVAVPTIRTLSSPSPSPS